MIGLSIGIGLTRVIGPGGGFALGGLIPSLLNVE